VSVLLTSSELQTRRGVADGPLRALADSLADDLEPVLAHELLLPNEKARLTRRGGRCETDGTVLEFDPFSPRSHRCPRCGAVYDDESHYRWWIMGYQLWLAERAVHAAALYALRGDRRHHELATAILDTYADRYLTYPNKDNVLGPTRPFFSTYLESIWVLQLIVALDVLESSGGISSSLSSRVRERVIEPSAALIASYDEGMSNRQVWNNAAMLAASRVLGRGLADEAVNGRSGLTAHLTTGLLGDGTWYEGENYHLFAHRGLWYGVAIAEAAGERLDATLVGRFDEAFATPFLSALPDFTFPSRRDSQYAVSLRQWRFAELAELGLVRQPKDARLVGALATLYDGTLPHIDTARARSTAEAERNTPATALARADLGWRSLLFAQPVLPPLVASSAGSVILRDQGLAILRRDSGAVYVALDYGHAGSGHGHPDRLNLMLVRGRDRWLDDVGTGSYVDPSLHWYRSTLAHNAPLVNGRSQKRVDGTLTAYDDRGAAGWVRAVVDDAFPGVRLERTIVAMPTYVIDELSWRSDRSVQVDLPFHAAGELFGVEPWTPAVPTGGTEAEDGFRFLTNTETTPGQPGVRLNARLGGAAACAHVFTDAKHDWWRAVSFGAPGFPNARFHFVRAHGATGTVTTVWDLSASVAMVDHAHDQVRVTLSDNVEHEHRADADGWHITLRVGGAKSTIDLAGFELPRATAKAIARPRNREIIQLARTKPPLTFELGERDYRRSESSWADAGKPTARVSVSVQDSEVLIVTDVVKRDAYFAPRAEHNPLDNEPADTNSESVQLHLVLDDCEASGDSASETTWLMAPDSETGNVRVTPRSTAARALAVRASWSRTTRGYTLSAALPLSAFGDCLDKPFGLAIIVNETSADRERRRGQLVLGGAAGEFVYLQGDRCSVDRHLMFQIIDD
jgi:hypothetical protein